MKYNKLIRDKIPEIIAKNGQTACVRKLTDDEYLVKLDEKLDEELAEYHADGNVEELADLLEVIYAVALARGCTADELDRIRRKKAEKRGTFAEKLLLEEVRERNIPVEENLKSCSKSINYLLKNAGPVIKYRLKKELLGGITPDEEVALLDEIQNMPNYKLVESYVKPNGYIGIGAHSPDRFMETRFQDGETAARLLSNYAIPKDWPIVANFVSAMRSDNILYEEFCARELERFEKRNLGLNCGGGLMVILYTMQALLGYGDDSKVLPFQSISLKAFAAVKDISSLADITKFNPNLKRKYNYPYVEPDDFLPCQYHLETLAHTNSWRTEANVAMLADAINNLNAVMRDDNEVSIKVGSRYIGPGWAYIRPFYPFSPTGMPTRLKELTHLAMLGVGENVPILRETADAILENLAENDGVLKMTFETLYQKKAFVEGFKYSTPYAEIGLEADYRKPDALRCNLTFWAVQFLYYYWKGKLPC